MPSSSEAVGLREGTKMATMTSTWLGSMFAGIANVVTHEVWPWVETLFSTIALDTVAALKPLAEQALTEIEGDIPALLANPASFLQVFNDVVAKLITAAEAAAIPAAMHDIIATVQALLANVSTPSA